MRPKMTSKDLLSLVGCGNATFTLLFGGNYFTGSIREFLGEYPKYPDYKHLPLDYCAVHWRYYTYWNCKSIKRLLIAECEQQMAEKLNKKEIA